MSIIPRRLFVLSSLFLVVLPLSARPLGAQELKAENVVLITTDGLRWEELFTGAEKALISREIGGVTDVKSIEAKFWRETPEERRAALMPFMWNTIAKEGQIFGNRLK